MKKIIALLLVASSALANETTNCSQEKSSNDVVVVRDLDTKGSDYITEICYRGALFIKHKLYTGGLTQVLDPVSGKPVQCVVKD